MPLLLSAPVILTGAAISSLVVASRLSCFVAGLSWVSDLAIQEYVLGSSACGIGSFPLGIRLFSQSVSAGTRLHVGSDAEPGGLWVIQFLSQPRKLLFDQVLACAVPEEEIQHLPASVSWRSRGWFPPPLTHAESQGSFGRVPGGVGPEVGLREPSIILPT